ncbi:MAG: hypothetical protein ACRDHM_07785 [Actinomycetota bacterium]
MSQPPVEDYQEAFSRIEAEVDRGNTDLAGLGFWRLVRQVKLEPRLAEHWADVAGRIDRKAFERSVRPRMPVWLGNSILLLASAVLIALLFVAIGLGRDAVGSGEQVLPGLIAVAAAGGLSVNLHDLAHWVVGRMAGIRFTAYFLKKPLLTPGLKIDYASYLRTSPGARAWMHASGAVVSKIAPFAVFAAVYLPHRAAGYDLFPSWSLWAILAIGVVQIITDILFSTKKSDWKRVRRELRIGRSMESIPRR